jgi:O-antigen chain-terminating methyltransferase
MFETVFYESPAVAGKQRVYLPYLDLELGARFPFLDLGCGRGEFLRILAGAGLRATGVDVNPSSFPALRADGFDVVEADLLAFLERDRGTYAGISLLQVAEHLTREQLERVLAGVAQRLAPGGIFILETPNPLSPFALGVFHTDPTHVQPLPPEAARYAIEAAGLERTRTLYQARIPRDQFAGPDPRSYYADYAILAWRPSP